MSDPTTGATDPAPLYRFHPELAEAVPRVSLGRLPTAVEPLRVDGIDSEIWVKRDDQSGAAYGGNKVRKLEFLLAVAERRGAGRLITAGAFGSHHALATTVYGRARGYPVTLVLFPQPVTRHVREVLHLDRTLGADLRFARRMETVPIALMRTRLAHRGERPAVIPPGGSDAIGTLGYVNAALELAEQVEAGAAPRPSVVYAPAGTLGTIAGLAIGFALLDWPTRIVGVRVVSRLVTNRRALRRLVNRTRRVLLKAGLRVPRVRQVLRRITLEHGRVGRGYGHETVAGRRAAERFAATGLTLDPTYTSKAAAHLLAAAAADPPGPKLFWHTLSAHMPDAEASTATPRDLPQPFRRFLVAGGG